MPDTVHTVTCPRYPDHGVAGKRLLPPDEREMITKWDGDVFEIDCPTCGKYECRAVDLETGV